MNTTCKNCGASGVVAITKELERCHQCYFLSVNDIERKRQQALFLNDCPSTKEGVAGLMKKYPKGDLNKNHLYCRVAGELFERMGRNKNIRVLDVGASGGGFLFQFEKLGVTGTRLRTLEISQDYIELTRAYYGYVSVRANIEDFSESGVFDIITLFDVLEHVDNFDVALKNIAQSLKDGGIAYLKLPNGVWAYLKLRTAMFFNKPQEIPKLLYTAPGGHLNYWSRKNCLYLERYGLRILRAGPVPPTVRQFKKGIWWRMPLFWADRFLGISLFPEFEVVLEKTF